MRLRIAPPPYQRAGAIQNTAQKKETGRKQFFFEKKNQKTFALLRSEFPRRQTITKMD
jgi:hypothetical protein